MDQYHLAFVAAFPNDFVFNEAGDILVPPGREAANAIADSFTRQGFACSEVTQRDYYGWEFRFTYQHSMVTAVLQLLDKWILTSTSRSSFQSILSGRSTRSLGQVAEEIAQALKADLPCDEIVVYSESDRPY